MPANYFKQDGNKLIHERLLNAPRELVWEVWTKPEHISQWWGPNGFTVTNKSMEVKPGSHWKFLFEGFGHTYDENIEYVEVEEPELLSYKHFGETSDYDFLVEVRFEDKGKQTLLTITSVFKSKAILDELNEKVGAIEGGKQTFDKMEVYLENLNQYK